MASDRAIGACHVGQHSDPDNSGMCIYCAVILDYCEPGEDPNDYRRRCGWSDVPVETEATKAAWDDYDSRGPQFRGGD